MKKNTSKTSSKLQRNIAFDTLKREGGYFKLDSYGAANANHLAGTGGNTFVAVYAGHASKNGSNMPELRAIKEGYYKLDSDGAANVDHLAGTAEIMRTDDGSLVVSSDAKHAFKNGSNMAELGAIKEVGMKV